MQKGMGKAAGRHRAARCAEVLASMEHIGILVDRNGIEAFGQELQTARSDAELARHLR